MPNVLVVGDTVHSTELRHSVPVAIGDPFHYVELDGRRLAVVWSVEGDRISAVDPTIEILPVETFPLDDLIRDGVDAYELQPIQSVRIARALGLRDAVTKSAQSRHCFVAKNDNEVVRIGSGWWVGVPRRSTARIL